VLTGLHGHQLALRRSGRVELLQIHVYTAPQSWSTPVDRWAASRL